MLQNILLSFLPMIPLYLGIYLVFVMRSDFDLGVAGTYGVGSAITAVMLAAGLPVWLTIACAILAAAAFGWQQWQAFQQVREAEEIDTLILTSDLPIDAYLDRGFQVWLKTGAER